ncbi:hypothetical protein DXG03_006089 [Asterophora parasitica]|uniref:DNA mismatch repair protein MutS-like N-terminal domain-containing protein n=1 Tax=Asterophora parasitica TaxID=117018 RepID=A0A9P7KGT9_9AGAR|nr:hypothetical protein DXG03_006089 [Asterophora parasitica]
MLILSTSLRRTVAFINRSAARAFSTQVADANVNRAVSKTVKAFASLPTAHLRPDGSVAEPLEDWWGGPDHKLSNAIVPSSRPEVEPPPKRRRVAKSAVSNAINPIAEAVDGSLGPHIDNPLIKKRSRKTKDSVTKLANNDDAEPISKQKRGRKPKVAPSEPIAVPEEPALKSVNLNAEGPQTILAQEILENLRKFPHCLLLTRVGQFYESYFDQAVEISRLLNIKLTTRKWGKGRVPMCGFPLMHLDKSLKALVQQNKRFVAMCEEFPRYSNTGVKMFDRRVTRVITPGTLIDESFLNPFENNYLLAISVSTGAMSNTTSLGLAWIDVSTGEFFSKSATLDGLRDELSRIGPREVVLDHSLEQMKHHPVFEALAEDDNFMSFFVPPKSSEETKLILPMPVNPIGTCGLDDTQAKETVGPEETSAIGLLTAYLHANLLDHMPVLSLPNHEGTDGRMQIDSHTIKALEIREGFREGGSPSTSITEINSRQSLVAFFHSRPHFKADLAEALAEAEDIGRIVQKFMLDRGDPNDLLAVQRTTLIWSSIVKRVEDEKQLEAIERSDFDEEDWASLDSLMSRMVELRDVSNKISMVLEGGSSSGDEPASESVMKVDDDEDGRVASSIESDGVWRYGPAKWAIKPG